jgi:hypothetical protein
MISKYLQDSNQSYLQQQINDWINSNTQDSEYLLLIDGALLTQREYILLQKQLEEAPLVSLYQDTVFSSMERYGIQALHFIPKYWDQNRLNRELAPYLKVCNRKPTFSIVKLAQSFDLNFWLWLVDLQLENDEQNYITRFADTHAFSDLYQILNSQQLAYMASYIDCWGIKNRKGEWQIFNFAMQHCTEHLEAFMLSEEQTDQLLRLSEADNIYATLSDSIDIETYFQTACDVQQHIYQLMGVAKKVGLNNYTDLLVFIKLFIKHNPEILTSYPIQSILKQIPTQDINLDNEDRQEWFQRLTNILEHCTDSE